MVHSTTHYVILPRCDIASYIASPKMPDIQGLFCLSFNFEIAVSLKGDFCHFKLEETANSVQVDTE